MTLLERLQKFHYPHLAKIHLKKSFVLIVPPSPYVVPTGWEWVHTAPFEGPSIIASIVKGLGYNFSLLDQREKFDANVLKDKLKLYDIIGISTYSDNFPYIKEICKIYKETNPNGIVILGGPLVSSAPELILKNTLADFAVFGEGELTIIELMDFIENNIYAKPKEEILGLAWKYNDKVYINKSRPQMQNLDFIPLQDLSVWDRFSKEEIPELYMSTSRGCPHSCTFCYRTMPKLCFMSPERVKEEIEYHKKRKFKHVWFNDLCFIVRRERVFNLMDNAFSVYGFSWNCFTRVSDVDMEVLSKMKEKGCNIILYGFEAISQKILDSYKKNISKEDMINAINITRDVGIKVGGLFVIGAPNETPYSLQRIKEFSSEFRDVTRVKYLSALPGTPLYKEALEKGLIKDEIAHLNFLAKEQSVEEDIDKEGFLLFSKNITRSDLREAYKVINNVIEKRPYEYCKNNDLYIENPQKFKKRCFTQL